jgi:hypothetical protein
MAPSDPTVVAEFLDGLSGWLGAVYLRYPDAIAALPECWCWHPDVVEELLWLMHAWTAAYQGASASAGLAGDWHDRQRPGVVRRIKNSAGTCSRENHQTRPGWDTNPAANSGPPLVPAEADLDGIARWWGVHRDEAAPEAAPRDDTGGRIGAVLNGGGSYR